jgi:rubrerythrin
MVAIELLVKHEEAIGKLYEACATKFPEFKTFWSTLAYEETDHAKKIRELIEERKLGHVTFDSTKYDVKSIETSLNYVAQQLKKVETGEISLITAFSIALDIEKAIIDGKVFEAFKGQTQKTRELIRDLAKSVTDHYQVIEQTWSENRRYS